MAEQEGREGKGERERIRFSDTPLIERSPLCPAQPAKF